jgi:hypothetical protein
MVKKDVFEGALILTKMDGGDLPKLVKFDIIKKYYG